MNKNKTKICSFVLLVCFVFGLYTLFHSTLTLSLRMRCSILKLSKYGTLMKKIRGILSDYGTPKNCRIMGPVGFWDRTTIFKCPIIQQNAAYFFHKRPIFRQF